MLWFNCIEALNHRPKIFTISLQNDNQFIIIQWIYQLSNIILIRFIYSTKIPEANLCDVTLIITKRNMIHEIRRVCPLKRYYSLIWHLKISWRSQTYESSFFRIPQCYSAFLGITGGNPDCNSKAGVSKIQKLVGETLLH